MTIELLESKIKIMNDDTFHRLGDHFLFYDEGEDYDSINPIGQAEGKHKSRGGTPDTKIRLTNGQSILIQYTTQDGTAKKAFYDKLIEDMQFCFDIKKTRIPISEIKEVVLCFNSNINTATERLLHQEAEKYKVPLKLVNLSTIAHKIYKYYPYLAKDYLSVDIDTYQLLPVKKFIEEYEKGGFATPLSNPLKKREKELIDIFESIQQNLITVVVGKPGVGKSRLAVEAVKNFSKGHRNFTGICIKSKDLPIIYDLRKSLIKGKKYLIYIDDANKSISHLKELISFYQESDLEFKLILTVRYYVLHEILPFTKGYTSSLISVDKLDNEQIRDIIRLAPFNIKNSLFQDRVLEVAKGNPRLAIMTAMACKGKNLDDLANVADIYDIYFHRVSADNQLLFKPSYIKVLGILSFFRIIDEDNTDTSKILKAFGVKKNAFWTKVYDLERYEIVDVFSDRSSVRFTDQILEGYIFYRTFFIDKILDYRTILNQFFNGNKYRVRYTAIDANNTFGFKDFGDRISPYVKDKYQKILTENGDLLEYLKIFWIYLQDETLVFAKDQIDLLPDMPDLVLTGKVVEAKYNTKAFEFEDGLKLTEDNDDELFGLLAEYLRYELEDFDLATELLFSYIEKRQHLAYALVKFCTSHFNFTNRDQMYLYYRADQFTDALIKKVEQGKPVFMYLFLNLLPHFLKTTYDSTTMNRRSFSMARTQPGVTTELLKIREKHWGCFDSHYANYPVLSLHVLKSIHQNFFPDFHAEMRLADWPWLLKIFNDHFDVSKFPDAYVINQFIELMVRGGVVEESITGLQEKALTQDYKWFLTLDWHLLRRKERWERENEDHEAFEKRFDELKKREILAYFALNRLEDYLKIFEFMGRCMSAELWEHYNTTRASHFLLEKAQEDEVIYLTLLTHLIKQPYFLKMFNSYRIFNMIQNNSAHLVDGVERLIHLADYPEKEKIQLGFYDTLYEQNISTARCESFLKVIGSLRGRQNMSFQNSVHYLKFDPEFLYKAISTLLTNVAVTNLEFTLHYDFIETNFSNLNSDIQLAENLYLHLEDAEDNYDYEGSELLFLLKLNPKFFNRYMDYLISNKKFKHNEHHQIGVAWKCECYLEIITSAIEKLMNAERYYHSAEQLVDHLFNDMVGIEQFEEKKAAFFMSCIRRDHASNAKLKKLFKLIIGRAGNHFGEIVKLYLSMNSDIQLFKDINWLQRSTYLMSGNAISAEIDEHKWLRLRNIISELTPKANFLKHKEFVNAQIDRSRKSAVHERKWNFLRDDG